MDSLLPERSAGRREFLAELRTGLPIRPDAVRVLSILACETHDQSVQKAALAGLARNGRQKPCSP